jgi:predicted dehydrogenase
MMNATYRRRDVLKLGTAAGVGMAVNMLGSGASVEEKKVIRIGFVGTGGRGQDLIGVLLKLPGVQIPALCDINEDHLGKAQDMVVKAGHPKPEGYSRSETDFLRLCDRKDLDLVINATPWQWHTPIAVAAMKAGKDTATEVPAAVTIDQCWELVETAEKTGKRCVLLENDCYDRETLLIMNLIQKGVLGEPLYAEAGYLHDIRAVKFNTVSNGEPWRLEHSIKRNGNIYPTHPMGPVAWWFDINRGDKMNHLVSMSTKSRSMKEFAIKAFGPNDYRAKTDYALGDVNTTLIYTEKGRQIVLHHDTNTPRVKEHLLRIQCTKGAFNCHMNKIFVEGRSNRDDSPEWRARHEWESTDEYRKQYDSKLWRSMEKQSGIGSHGGIDYMEMYRLIKCLQEGKEPDIDVYDAAAWSAISQLSETSVANRSAPMEFPDFTRGRWKNRPRLDIDSIV